MKDEIPRIHIELEKTLSTEWVKESIRVEIEKIVKEAILNIKDNFSLRKIITDSISENLVKIFNKEENNDNN